MQRNKTYTNGIKKLLSKTFHENVFDWKYKQFDKVIRLKEK